MGESNKTGGPAFPVSRKSALRPVTNMAGEDVSGGMTLRDYFAAQVLIGMHANPEFLQAATSREVVGDTYADKCAVVAYRYADAMLRARAQ